MLGGQRETRANATSWTCRSTMVTKAPTTSILVVMVRDGRDGVCACAGASSSVASFASEYTF
jgi:hypothetical protein